MWVNFGCLRCFLGLSRKAKEIEGWVQRQFSLECYSKLFFLIWGEAVGDVGLFGVPELFSANIAESIWGRRLSPKSSCNIEKCYGRFRMVRWESFRFRWTKVFCSSKIRKFIMYRGIGTHFLQIPDGCQGLGDSFSCTHFFQTNRYDASTLQKNNIRK